ncbi:uncharacterized protein LTHEOB_4665 [Lasiodiplodia theobromae]|uniref:uncharacterized protein n=1 Tax=Lasiodiplodia theobromae TaxID=45133 RepID=UPI0015C3F294|nr:uncharacterized protein LTHEOB_4665 [Lasiodiplodia theobromae]KAF4546013.1 hypothetical protein LTHEOB_4665 [Lasiodiplodia theobromae]
MSSSYAVPDWLGKQSTIGGLRMDLPPPPADGDLGFQLPPAPTTSAAAIALINSLRTGGLPSSTHYNDKHNGLRQNCLVQAVFKLLLQSMDVWASDQANTTATYVVAGKEMRRHQISPLGIGFLNAATRERAYQSWERGLLPEVATLPETADALIHEKAASGTIIECTLNHRTNSGNLYLVSTKNHPSLGQSFDVRKLQRLGSAGIDEARKLVEDKKKREEHENRGGKDHEVAVYITPGSANVYIYDPAFEMDEWPVPTRLPEAMMLNRVKQLLCHLKDKNDKALKKAKILIGGGGNDADNCRAMAVEWIVGVVAQQWMGLDGPEVAEGPPMYFGDGSDQQELRW